MEGKTALVKRGELVEWRARKPWLKGGEDKADKYWMEGKAALFNRGN